MVNEFENTLRSLIIKVIGDADDSPYKISEERIITWKEKREIELKKFHGVLSEQRLLYFSDFYDLRTIIHKNWESFLSILIDKKRFEVFFSEVEKFRNTLAHGRTLTSSQTNLLNGIITDLKNQVTIYHNKNEMKEDYFIHVTRVSDNLGNVWPTYPTPSPTLRVGDEYELIVDANDPKDRIILYRLIFDADVIVDNQESNKFKLKFEKNHIGRNKSILIQAFTPEADYENKHGLVIDITVLPE